MLHVSADLICFFYYVSARWPGSVNDARVLRNSTLFERFQNGWKPFPNAVILGDSAYPLKDWLIPPLISPTTRAEQRFNVAHKSTRRVIENAFGVLKERFSCLYSLRVQPEFACEIFKTCCTLHNITLINDDDVTINVEEMEDDDIDPNNDIDQPGRNRRANLIRHFV